MTHQEMQDTLAEGIESGDFLAIVQDDELRFYHRDHIGVSITQEDADRAISADEYRRLSDADHAAQWN